MGQTPSYYAIIYLSKDIHQLYTRPLVSHLSNPHTIYHFEAEAAFATHKSERDFKAESLFVLQFSRFSLR
ncbi:hypothetical protein L1887_03054 [Cichorium endivia]|nr:hypothetical protein L1887_03054 [Cichorium endivia]